MIDSIVIIEHSNIIKEGLSNILSKHKIAHKICSFDSFDSINNNICNCEFSIIITNPSCIIENIPKTKKHYNIPEKTNFIALVYSYIEKDIINSFSDAIYIDDTPSVIINKIQSCLNSNNQIIKNPLSKREIEILKMLVKGLTNKEVAIILCLSVHTVVTHRKNIMEKTAIKSLSGLAVYAIVNGIMDIQDIK